MIHLITGPMFSGKSKYLIELLNTELYKNPKLKIAYIYPKDSYRGYFTRDENTIIREKINIITDEELQQILLDGMMEIDKLLQYNIIGVDEWSFMHKSDCDKIIDNIGLNPDKKLFIASLDMDYQKNVWENISDLINKEIVSIHSKITGICKCGKRASFSKRKTSSNTDRVLIGSDIYECVCKDCYNKD